MKNLIKILFVALIAYFPTNLLAQDPNAPIYAETIHGAVSIGAGNPWNVHFGTDEGKRFWFNRPIWVKGGEIGSYQSDLKLLTHNKTRMTILRDNGYVGIGIENPETHLHVKGSIRATNNVDLDKYFEFTHGGAGSFINHVGTGFMHFRFEGANSMVVAPGNKVGIGRDVPQANLDVRGIVRIGETTMPAGYKLYVEDGILTERVRIASKDDPIEWADYVFESDYDLNSTKEVKTFIQKNKHLPNVPSAKEVAEKGVDIVEMDATLLRQIEELWLHTIQLNERIEELEKQLEDKSDK